MAEKTLQEQLAELEVKLKAAATDEAKKEAQKLIDAFKAEHKDQFTAEEAIEIKGLKAEIKVLKDAADKNQIVIDKVVAEDGKRKVNKPVRTFSEAFAQAVEEAKDKFLAFDLTSRKSTFSLEIKDFSMKTVGDMTTSVNLSGDPVFSYNVRQGLIPADKINLRDLIPTAFSATGQYITYTEGAGEGAPAVQTEGSAKAQIDSDFTNVKIVNTYLAAFQRFSKQFMYNLPWVQSTLSRILLRRFYQKENSLFYANLSTNSTAATTSASNDAERIIDMIAQQGIANFASSFFLIP